MMKPLSEKGTSNNNDEIDGGIFNDDPAVLSSIRTRNKLGYASIICASFVVVEFIGGYLSGSLAVWSDAAHLCTDLFAFLIAMMASHISATTQQRNNDQRSSSKKFNFGYSRLESLAALFSVSSLVIVTLYLLWESFSRFVLILVHHHFHDRESTLLDFIRGSTGGITGIDTTDFDDEHNHHDNNSTTANATTAGAGGGGGGTTTIDENDENIIDSFVNGGIMSATAALGVFVNVLLALILKENHVHLPGSNCNHDHSSSALGSDGVQRCGAGCGHDHGPKIRRRISSTTSLASSSNSSLGNFEMMNTTTTKKKNISMSSMSSSNSNNNKRLTFCQPINSDNEDKSRKPPAKPPAPPPFMMNGFDFCQPCAIVPSATTTSSNNNDASSFTIDDDDDDYDTVKASLSAAPSKNVKVKKNGNHKNHQNVVPPGTASASGTTATTKTSFGHTLASKMNRKKKYTSLKSTSFDDGSDDDGYGVGGRNDIETGVLVGDDNNDGILATANTDGPPPSSSFTTNINLDAAYLHALTDLIQSVLVLVVGIIIWYKPNWYWLDPVLTFCFCIMVLYSSKPIFQRSLTVLLDVCPDDDGSGSFSSSSSSSLYDDVYNIIDKCVVESLMHTNVGSLNHNNADADDDNNKGGANEKTVRNLRIWYITDGRIGLTVQIDTNNRRKNRKQQHRSSNSNKFMLRLIQTSITREYNIQKDDMTIQIS